MKEDVWGRRQEGPLVIWLFEGRVAHGKPSRPWYWQIEEVLRDSIALGAAIGWRPE